MGINWSLLTHVIALVSTRISDMQRKIDRLNANTKMVGVNINSSKTKSMSIGTETAKFTIESVDSFTCLGSEIIIDGGAKKDVKLRIRKAQFAFVQLNNIWRSNHFSYIHSIAA